MKIVTCEDVKETFLNFLKKPPESLEEILIWKYWDNGGQTHVLDSELSKRNLKFLDTYLGYGFYDLGTIHAYPNTTTCKSTGVKGEREELTYNNLFDYYPRISTERLLPICKQMRSGKTSDICKNLKEDFKELTGEDFIALSDSGLISELIWKFDRIHTFHRTNDPELKLKITGENFECYFDSSEVVDIPTGVSLTYHQMKQEKEALESYPNKYLSKKILGFAVSKSIINTWEYKFYLDILSKPKPRKLSQRQANMYKTINSKIRRSL